MLFKWYLELMYIYTKECQQKSREVLANTMGLAFASLFYYYKPKILKIHLYQV